MERDEFKILVKAMKAVYPDPKFIPDADAFNVWYSLLIDLSYEQANKAVQRYMMTEKFPPTIADIRAKASETESKEMECISELEAWSLVTKAICNSNYYAAEEFEKLPRECQLAVGSPAVLREWAMMNSDQVHTVEQSHFIRSYRTIRERAKLDARLPEHMRTMALAVEQKEALKIETKALDEGDLPAEEPTEEAIQRREQMLEELRRRFTSAG